MNGAPFDKALLSIVEGLRTGFDRALLSKVEGLRANGCNYHDFCRDQQSMNTIAKHLTIRGRVQGVGFRHFMNRTAHELHVTGWVRNRRDGSVEAVISGAPEAVHTMVERARHGPAHAMVTEFTVADAAGSFARFEMRPTE